MNPVLKAILLTALALLVVAAGIWLAAGGSAGLRLAALEWFERYWGEEFERADELTATRYLSSSSRAEYEKLREFYRQRLGAYEGEGELLEETVEDDRGVLRLMLRFEKQEVEAYFGLLQEQGGWKIERFRLELPRRKDSDSPAENPRLFALTMLEIWAENAESPVWKQFDDDLRRRWSKSAFQKASKDVLAELGVFRSARETSFTETGDDRARLEAELTFEQGTRQAALEVVYRGGRWYASAFEFPGL